jgi:hypothetical protein
LFNLHLITLPFLLHDYLLSPYATSVTSIQILDPLLFSSLPNHNMDLHGNCYVHLPSHVSNFGPAISHIC